MDPDSSKARYRTPPTELRAGAIGQSDSQRRLLAQQRRQFDRGVGRQHDHVARADALYAVISRKRLDQQAAGAQIEAVIATITGSCRRVILGTKATGEAHDGAWLLNNRMQLRNSFLL